MLKDFVPTFDATVVSRLRAAGAVVLGKLNLSEGATAGYNPAFDVPLNPWNHDRWPGMSSSGSGVATAAGLCFAAIGTDTGGSIRNPASANGVVGLKPTYGRVSRYGVLVMSDSLDHVGTMARRVADAAIMFDAIAGPDPNDPTSLAVPPVPVMEDLDRGVRGMRIASPEGGTDGKSIELPSVTACVSSKWIPHGRQLWRARPRVQLSPGIRNRRAKRPSSVRHRTDAAIVARYFGELHRATHPASLRC